MMSIRRFCLGAMILGIVGTLAGDSRAGIIASNTGGPGIIAGSYYLGQSFTTVAGPVSTNITFSFFSDIAATTP